jgi:hypothetical protein
MAHKVVMGVQPRLMMVQAEHERSRRRQERRGWPLVKGASPRPEKACGYSQKARPDAMLDYPSVHRLFGI